VPGYLRVTFVSQLIVRCRVRFAAGLLMLALRFGPRMWSSENERLGLKSCTPLGYGILCAADLVSLAALVLLLSLPIYLIYMSMNRRLAPSASWFLLLPFGIAFFGSLVMLAAWSLARAKRFRYDYTSDTSRWLSDGLEMSYPDRRT
jgi:hypothetical protein